MFQAIAGESLRRIDEFSAQDLAKTVGALATVNVTAPRFFEGAAQAALLKISDFVASDVASMTSAYAKVGIVLPQFLQALAGHIIATHLVFTPVDLVNTVTAFVTALGESSSDIVRALAGSAVQRMAFFSAQDMANAAWAFATTTTGAQKTGVFDAIATEASKRIHEFDARALAETLGTFARAGATSPHFFLAVAKATAARLPEFSAKHLATIVSAFATAGLTEPQLFDVIGSLEAPRRMTEFSLQDMANTGWAFATAGIQAPALFDAIAAQLSTVNEARNPQDMANLMWAFACIGWESSGLFLDLASSIAGSLADLDDSAQSLLYLAALYVQSEYPDLASFPLAPHLGTLRTAYLRLEPPPGQLQADVSAALLQMGWPHTPAYVTSDGIALDCAQVESQRAIEVHGPAHYLLDVASGTFVTSGYSRFTSRLLRALGWDVVDLAFFDWEELNPSERHQLLLDKLHCIGVQLHRSTAMTTPLPFPLPTVE